MLIYSLSLSVDGFIADREGAFNWSAAPDEDLFRFQVTQTGELGSFLFGRRLYETMLVWETDPSMRDSGSTPRSPTPGARSRRSSSATRSTASKATPGSPRRRWPRKPLRRSPRPTRTSGSATRAPRRGRDQFGLVDELRMYRYPVVVGGGTPFLPPVTEDVRLDLIEPRTFGSRVIYERYGRAGRRTKSSSKDAP